MKDIKGYESFYQVSKEGIVFSKRFQRPLKPFTNRKGYVYVDLFDGQTRVRKGIHQLVAETFLVKPDYECEVDHLDTDKSNNHVDNLEWVTRLENLKRSNKGKGRKVAKTCKETGIILDTYESMGEAVREGFRKPEIIKCCRGRLKSHYGFGWKYLD